MFNTNMKHVFHRCAALVATDSVSSCRCIIQKPIAYRRARGSKQSWAGTDTIIGYNRKDHLDGEQDGRSCQPIRFFMRIKQWASFAPSLPLLNCRILSRSACTVMSAAGPTWVNLMKTGIARHKNDPTAKYCQLATAAIGGGASCRTWVFRGFWEDTVALKFITDRRSKKIPEIAADPVGEVCFYLTKTREQFRIKGRLQVIAAGESDERLAKTRRHQWTQISPSARASFETSLIPGEEVLPAGDGSGEMDAGGVVEGDAGPSGEPNSEFCLVLLWPNRVDHLVLREGQTREVHTLREGVDGGAFHFGGGGKQGEVSGDGFQSIEEWTTVSVNP